MLFIWSSQPPADRLLPSSQNVKDSTIKNTYFAEFHCLGACFEYAACAGIIAYIYIYIYIYINSIYNISCSVAFEVPTSEQPLAAADRSQFAEDIQAHRFQIRHITTIFETQRDAVRCHSARGGVEAWKPRRRRAQRRWHPAVPAWFHAQSVAKREGEKRSCQRAQYLLIQQRAVFSLEA